MPENHAILLTAPGPAAIAVVRLIGNHVRNYLNGHFSKPLSAGHASYGEIRDHGQVIDDAIVLLASDGASADINLHGGKWIVHRFLELAQRTGFAIVNASTTPLDARAVDASTVIEREMLQWLPAARTELALRALLAQPTAWKSFEQLDESAKQRQAGAMLEDYALFHLLNPPRIAIIGPANVGKSTLANQLFAQERSITADLPGTTRDWVGELANIDGLTVELADTPGIRPTDDLIERSAIHSAAEQIQLADCVIVVLDLSQKLEDQRPILNDYPSNIVVANKSDRPALWRPESLSAMRTIATRGVGIDELRNAIRHRFGCENLDLSKARCWTDAQRVWLKQVAIRNDSIRRYNH